MPRHLLDSFTVGVYSGMHYTLDDNDRHQSNGMENYTALAVAVLNQAFRDLLSARGEQRGTAVLFFAADSPLLAHWCSLAGVGTAVVLNAVQRETNGRARFPIRRF